MMQSKLQQHLSNIIHRVIIFERAYSRTESCSTFSIQQRENCLWLSGVALFSVSAEFQRRSSVTFWRSTGMSSIESSIFYSMNRLSTSLVSLDRDAKNQTEHRKLELSFSNFTKKMYQHIQRRAITNVRGLNRIIFITVNCTKYTCDICFLFTLS